MLNKRYSVGAHSLLTDSMATTDVLWEPAAQSEYPLIPIKATFLMCICVSLSELRHLIEWEDTLKRLPNL